MNVVYPNVHRAQPIDDFYKIGANSVIIAQYFGRIEFLPR